jgi:hypothetical protein
MDMYAMQRANGDWFVHEINGRLSLLLFHTVHDALMSRLRNFAMLVFKPVRLDSSLLSQLISEGGGKDFDFCMLEDPFVRLEHGQMVRSGKLLNLTNPPLERFAGEMR